MCECVEVRLVGSFVQFLGVGGCCMTMLLRLVIMVIVTMVVMAKILRRTEMF